MKTLDLGTRLVEYQDDQATRDAVYEKVLDWFIQVETFSGEGVMQNDTPLLEAPQLLVDLADDIFQFDVKWEGD